MKNLFLIFLFPIITHSQISTNGLVIHLPFSNNCTDNSSNGIATMPSISGFGMDRFGNNQNGAVFNGNEDKIILNDNLPLITTNSFAISGWMKMEGQGGGSEFQNVLFQQRDDNATFTAQSTILLVPSTVNNQAVFLVRSSINTNASSVSISTPSPAFSEWHHYLGMKCDNRIYFYIDGVLIGFQEFNQTGDFITSIDYVSIGEHSHTTGSVHGSANGLIDDFIIYNRCLSLKEINELYTNSFLSINENESVEHFTISPNPINEGNINISIADESSIKSIQVIDLSGKIVFSIVNNISKNLEIPFDVTSGLYLFQGLDSNQNVLEIQKVVKN
jgi:hypothetical protein